MPDVPLDPGIVLKITPPKLRKSLLVRERLREIRAASDDIAVFLIEAPAGYGKTSLLAQWRLDWLQSGALVGWVSFDAGDKPTQVVSAIVESLRRAAGRTAANGPKKAGTARVSGTIAALTALLAAIADDATRTVLVFDDCERIDDPAVLEIVEYLVHNLPPNLQIAAGSRHAIPLQTADLIAHGNLRRITTAELRLDLPETMRLLSTRLGSRADAELCGRLHEVTQGWPLGVQLAASALERTSDWERALATFSTSREDATRQLFDGMVATLPSSLQDFITRCALLDALHPALCEAVTGDEDAALALQRLLAETPLVTAVEDSEWLRLHPLAREFLRARAQSAIPAAERDALHRRAWQWLEQHGLFAQAAHHAISSGHEDEAYALVYSAIVERGMNEALARGEVEGAIELVRTLPTKNLPNDPRMRLINGWIQGISGRAAGAIPDLTLLASDSEADPVIHREAIGLLVGVLLAADRLDSALHHAAEYPAGATDSRTARIAACARSLASLHRGDTADARRQQDGHPDDGNFLGVRALADITIGSSFLWEGRPRDAERAVHVRYVRLDALGYGPWAAVCAGLLAIACWERDRREEARALPAHRHATTAPWLFQHVIGGTYQTLARMAILDGDEARAFALIEQPASMAARLQTARLQVESLVERIRLHAALQRPRQCAALLDELATLMQTADVEPLLMPLLQLQLAMAHAFAALAAEDDNAAASHLDAAWAVAQQIKRARETIQILALRAVLAERAGESPDAPLAEALSLAEAGEMVRVFADTLPGVIETIRRWVDSGAGAKTAIRRGFIDQVLAAASAEPSAETARIPATPTNAILTPKESEVLRLLAGGMPNKRIAASLGLSSETVKWHMKKLFTKLDAGNRQHAVERARMLGLIS